MKSKNRISRLQIFHFVAIGLFLVWPALARAQTVVATIPLHTTGPAVAVNPLTNEIYVASCSFLHFYSIGGGPVAVIDGQTNAFTAYMGGTGCASAFVVNPATNKIYLTCSP